MIYIFCPRCDATGGTELMHQLGYTLNLLGFEAAMIYYEAGEKRGPVSHPHFAKYHVPIVEEVVDARDTIAVFPEPMAKYMDDVCAQLELGQKVLWWLSVDGAKMSPEDEENLSKHDDIIHMVQSYYARDYVNKKIGVPEDKILYLSDYINSMFLNIKNDFPRENVVLFNPRKGFPRTSQLIMKSGAGIAWRALNDIVPSDVPEILSRAKVYIDFGGHPGKDRFPREAAVCGCRIITGRRGSAAFHDDVPIPEELKFDDDAPDQQILSMIYLLTKNYDTSGALYEEYIDFIKEEFHTFEADVFSIFHELSGSEIRIPKAVYSSEDSLIGYIVDEFSNGQFTNAFYAITLYRKLGYAETPILLALEIYTRLGIEDYYIAEYLSDRLIGCDSQNYEAYLLRAQAILGEPKADKRTSEVISDIDKALSLAEGTEDAEEIGRRANALVELMRSVIPELNEV